MFSGMFWPESKQAALAILVGSVVISEQQENIHASKQTGKQQEPQGTFLLVASNE